MLRIFLFGLSNRRQQPKRYAQYTLKFVENIIKNDLYKNLEHDTLKYKENCMKIYLISLLIGLIAAVIDVAPMIIRKMDKLFIISAFFVWIVLGIFIPRINFVSISFLNGIIVSVLFVLPMTFLIYKLDPNGLPVVIVTTIILGCGVGFFSRMIIG
jgi:hypothetical protein